jgi:hypothetical protein
MGQPRIEHYTFSPGELLDLGKRLARSVEVLAQLEQRKKDQAREVGEDIKEQRRTVMRLTRLINDGYEMREVSDQTDFAFGGDLRSASEVIAEVEKPKRERKQ